MKPNLSYIVECYADEILVRTVLKAGRREISHQPGKSRALKLADKIRDCKIMAASKSWDFDHFVVHVKPTDQDQWAP